MASMRGDLATMGPLLEAAERVIDRADEEPFQPSTGPEGSLLVNARAMLALQRSYAAQLRGDAAATAALTGEAMEQLGENELMLSSAVQGFLAMAEWLHGMLAAAGSLRVQHRVVAPGRPGHHHRVGVLLPGPPAPGPGPSRCRRRHLRAGPGGGLRGRGSGCGLLLGPRWSGWVRSPISGTTSTGRWST